MNMVTRIKSVNVGELSRIARKRTGGKTSGTTSSSASSRADDADFSPGARILGMAGDAANAAPEVRMDLVEPIREALSGGRYHVSSLDVADKILRQVLKDRKKSF